jgi:periplasmic divalent cation tolerance protein
MKTVDPKVNDLAKLLLTVEDNYLEHDLKKQLLLIIHELKTSSRKSADIELEQSILDIESNLGFGANSSARIDLDLLDRQIDKITEFCDDFDDEPNEDSDVYDYIAPKKIDEDLPSLRVEAQVPHETADQESDSDHSESAAEASHPTSASTVELVEDSEPEFLLSDEELMLSEDLIDNVENNTVTSSDEPVAAEPKAEPAKQQGIVLILTNCPGRDPARELAHKLVEHHQAACVNVIANIGAIYWWEGEIHDTAECQLQIKTSAESVDQVMNTIKILHPNKVPEILVLPINAGNQEYFDWVKFETSER